MTTLNRYKFPIGDWSGDGHEKCDEYIVQSPASIDAIREAHFSCITKLGFDIGSIAEDYEDSTLDDDILAKLFEHKVVTLEQILSGRYGIEEEDEGEMHFYDSKGLLQLWIDILNYLDPSLKLEAVNESAFQSINFYGFDEKKRHLNTPGYGLFY